MSACETCWADAYFTARVRGTSHVEEYQRLIADHTAGNITDPSDRRWTGSTRSCAPHCTAHHSEA